MTHDVMRLLAGLWTPLVLAALTLACGESNGGDAPTSARPSGSAPAVTPADGLDALLRGISGCPVGSTGKVDLSCAAAQDLGSWAAVNKAWLSAHAPEAAAIGRRYLADPSNAVRVEALHLVTRRVKDDPEIRRDVAARGKLEHESSVMVVVATTAARAPDDPELRALLLTLLDHADQHVRTEAVFGLVPIKTAPQQEVRAAIAKALESGELSTRKRICERIRVEDDPSLLALVSRQLDSPDTPAALFESCFYGLAISWLGPETRTPSRAAYARFAECLETCVRDERHDTTLGMWLLHRPFEPDKLKNPIPSFADLARIERAIIAIAKDTKASEKLRAGAISVYPDVTVASERTGLTPAQIDGLLKAAAPATPPADAGP